MSARPGLRRFGAIVGFAGLGLVVAALATWGSAVVLGSLTAPLTSELRHVSLAEPRWLGLLALPFAAVALRSILWPGAGALRHSRGRALRGDGPGLAARLVELPDGLVLAAAFLLVIGLARPQSTRINEAVEHEGIDIAIVLDLSDSMESADVRPTRLAAAKEVIDDFIARRPHDRIALVVFGATASTVSPLTLDHDVVRALVQRMRLKVINGQRTAIGAGLGVALNRLAESEAKSKVVVLLTDGVHNAGGVDPDTVAEEAARRGVVIYTVLVGEQGGRFGGKGIDADQLERIAEKTDGAAYRAADRAALQTSFQDLLDRLERSVVAANRIRAELFAWCVWPALALLLLATLLRNTRLRRFP